MALPIPPLQDVVRLTGSDVVTTAANLRKHLQGARPVWSYSPSKRLSKPVFSLKMTRDAAVRSCGRIGHKLGRPHNEEVGGLIWDTAAQRGQFMCHDLSPRQLNLRADIAIKVDPQFFFIERGRPAIFYLQPRQGHVPAVDGLRVIATAIHSLFAVDELAAADLLLLDLSKPAKCNERAMMSYSFLDLPPLPTAEVERFFQRFVDAYDLITQEGVEQKPRSPRQPPIRATIFSGPRRLNSDR